MNELAMSVGSHVMLREVFRPLGAWKFDSPSIPAGTVGRVEPGGDRFAIVVAFPGHLPVRVPRRLLKKATSAVAMASPAAGEQRSERPPPAGLPPTGGPPPP